MLICSLFLHNDVMANYATLGGNCGAWFCIILRFDNLFIISSRVFLAARNWLNCILIILPSFKIETDFGL